MASIGFRFGGGRGDDFSRLRSQLGLGGLRRSWARRSAASACRGLGGIGHRGGGVGLEIAGGRRRDVGGLGARDSPHRSRALARGVSDWPMRGVSDGGRQAEVAETVRNVAATAISTRSNPLRSFEQSRIVTPPGRNCPGIGTVLRNRLFQHARKAPAQRLQLRYACTQRVKRRRYIRPFRAASAMRGNSRQTDL